MLGKLGKLQTFVVLATKPKKKTSLCFAAKKTQNFEVFQLQSKLKI